MEMLLQKTDPAAEPTPGAGPPALLSPAVPAAVPAHPPSISAALRLLSQAGPTSP